MQCLLPINIQQLLCTVIEFHALKEAVLYFVEDLNLEDNHVAGYQSNLQFIDS